MENNQLASIIQESGIARLFRHESGIPKVNSLTTTRQNGALDMQYLIFLGSQ
jgi:hypothetical protein